MILAGFTIVILGLTAGVAVIVAINQSIEIKNVQANLDDYRRCYDVADRERKELKAKLAAVFEAVKP